MSIRTSVALVLALGLLVQAAWAEERIPLRYNPAPGTTWATQGHIAVTNAVTLPDGQESKESQDCQLSWVDRVTDRDVLGTVVQEREIRTLGSEGDLVPSQRIGLRFSKLFQQENGGSTGPVPFDQPALFPTRSVAVGETWPVEQTSKGVLPLGGMTLPVQSAVRGTGTLSALEGPLAVLDFALEVEVVGPVGASPAGVETRSTSKVQWTMKVDRASGVPVWQRTVSRTEQAVTLRTPGAQPAVVPGRMESVMEVTTTRL